MNPNKTKIVVNIVLAVLWLSFAVNNAMLAIASPDMIGYASAICTIDILLSRGDFILAWYTQKCKERPVIYDGMMNKFSILAAIGAAIFIPLTGLEIANNDSDSINIAFVFKASAAIFMLITTYVLGIKARIKYED